MKLGGLKRFEGVYDWKETARQNPDLRLEDIPLWAQIMVHGCETPQQAQARARRIVGGWPTEPFPALVA